MGSLRLLQVKAEFILWGLVAVPLQSILYAEQVSKFLFDLSLTEVVDELFGHALLQQGLQFFL